MKKFLSGIIVILGLWLVVSPWFLGYADGLSRYQDGVVGLLIAAMGLCATLSKKSSLKWPFYINALLSLLLIASGIALWGSESIASRLNDIILGLLIAFLSLFAMRIVVGQGFHISTREGIALVDISSMVYKKGVIEMKGKAFGAMPQIMRIDPEQLWLMLGLLPASVITHLPGFLFAGWQSQRKKKDS